jgi:KDO2-lipid IV(A) lauroyltransferase
MAELGRLPALRGGLRAATAVTRALGRARYMFADTVGLVAYRSSAARASQTLWNHQRCAPQIDLPEARRRARASYREYARTLVDFVWVNDMDHARVRGFSAIRGWEHVTTALEQGKGSVFALSHFGNWDMAANIAIANGLELTTVMAPLGPEAITEVVVWARQQNQLEVFTAEQAARGLFRALRRNRFVCLLCDIPEAGPTVLVDYCGGPVEFSSVPAWLALRFGAPLMPVDCYRVGRDYVIDVHPPVVVDHNDSETAVMQRVAAVLENTVRRLPDQWYPFGKVYADAG